LKMKSSLYLGQFAKVKVFVHWTFLILIVYIIFAGISAGDSTEAIGWHVLFILTIFLCVVLHEFGHALTGRRFGFKTKDIILLPIGGVARFEKLPENPRQEFLVAIAGPMVNFFIAGILYVITQPSTESVLALDFTTINATNFLMLLWMINLSLGLFNLIPAFPMDGGRIFRALLAMFLARERATAIAAALGIVLAVVFIFAGFYYNPFLILIGVFIILSASSETSIVKAKALLEGHTVGEIVMHDYASLDHDIPIAEASEVVLDGQSVNFAVTAGDKDIIGYVSKDQIIKSLTNSDHYSTRLSEIMTVITQTIPIETPLKELYANPLLRKNALLPVSDKGAIIGVINLENILEFLAIKQATLQWKNLLKRNKPH